MAVAALAIDRIEAPVDLCCKSGVTIGIMV
jgi:hypothetical protein